MTQPSSSPSSAPRRNLAHEIVVQLRGAIISGKLQPGEALAEPVLAKQFGSSRAPIREALIELEREGLVQFEITGRTRVRTLTEKLLTYALGRGLESYDGPAVRQITKRAADGDYRLSTLILEIVRSTPFQMRRAGEVALVAEGQSR